MSATNNDPEVLLSFYEEKRNYYTYWAKHHKIGYWVLLWAIILTGIATAGGLLLHVATDYIAIMALALNVLLIISKAIGTDEKYARYRSTELKLQFLLQSLQTDISVDIKNGEDREMAILENIKKYHTQIQELVLSEFDQHFSKQKSLKDVHGLLSENLASAKANKSIEPTQKSNAP